MGFVLSVVVFEVNGTEGCSGGGCYMGLEIC